MKPHRMIITGALACMLGIASLTAMGPAELDTMVSPNKLSYNNEDSQKFMLLQEMAKKHEQDHRDNVPMDITHEMKKKHAEVTLAYNEAEAIADRATIIDGVITLNPEDQPNNLVLQILFKKNPELKIIDLSYFKEIINLTMLKELKNLTYIDISDCTRVTDLSPLRELSDLREIYMSNCTKITDLLPLQNALLLTRVDISGCTRIMDLSPLHGKPYLAEVFMRGCIGITDLSPLQRVCNLNRTCIYTSGCTGITKEYIECIRMNFCSFRICVYA